MSLASQVGLLATRVGTECKNIRNSFVPNAQRGPIGGITSSTGVTGAVTIDPALSIHRRLTATGDVTINLMAAGADGQRILFEVNASAGQRVVTFDPGYELSAAVPVRSFTIPSGGWAYITVIYRGTTWRLTSAEPQAVPDYSTPSAWVPSDHGFVAWTADPILATATFGPPSGCQTQAAVKVSSNATLTQVAVTISTAGTNLTAGRNLIGLYNSAGSLVGQTADQSAAWASTGNKTASWTSAVTVTPGTYYPVILVGTTGVSPVFTAYAGGPVASNGRSANGYRGGFLTGSATTLPATKFVPGSTGNPIWFGLG
jgi:hypothetical protein